MDNHSLTTPHHSAKRIKSILSSGFVPLCNGTKLRDLTADLGVENGAQSAREASVSLDLASPSASEFGSPQPSKHSTPSNVCKVKKQVRFSDFSTMGLFLPPVDAHEMYWTKAEKDSFKLNAVRTAIHIHATLQTQSPTAPTPAPTAAAAPATSTTSTKPADVPPLLPLLLALQKGNSFPAEELIGLEDLIQGLEHVRNTDANKKKINRIIVLAWRHLKQEEVKRRQQGQQGQRGWNSGEGTEGREDAIARAISELYKKINRKSLLKARCHAAYVHGLNRGVDSMSSQSMRRSHRSQPSQSSQGHRGTKRRRTMCQHVAQAA